MKRSFHQFALTAALLLTLGVGSSFALPITGTDNINASFHKKFRTAELLSRETGKAYTKLTFKMNGMILFAFYSDKGELLAITHNIKSSQLPLSLLIPVKRDYDSYWISDLFECSAHGTTSYYLTLENADSKITLRSNDGSWATYTTAIKE